MTDPETGKRAHQHPHGIDQQAEGITAAIGSRGHSQVTEGMVGEGEFLSERKHPEKKGKHGNPHQVIQPLVQAFIRDRLFLMVIWLHMRSHLSPGNWLPYKIQKITSKVKQPGERKPQLTS